LAAKRLKHKDHKGKMDGAGANDMHHEISILVFNHEDSKAQSGTKIF
jgi:hypothetical protein